MASEASMIADLADILKEGLDDIFTVLPATFYVALVHPEYGLAAVVPSDKEAQAQAAASDLSTKAAQVGVAWPALHFGISQTRVSPPWLIRAGAGTIVDLLTTIRMLSSARPVLGPDAAVKVANSIVTTLPLGSAANIVAAETSVVFDVQTQRMIRVSVEKALAGRKAWLAGVEIDEDDFAAPNFLLPALLVAAAQKWTAPVLAKKGQGGFKITMHRDRLAVLGYKVSSVDFASPLFLFVSVVDVIRRSFRNGECVMDQVVQEFSDYLARNKLDNSDLEDLEANAAVN